jgi:hypothetical protein
VALLCEAFDRAHAQRHQGECTLSSFGFGEIGGKYLDHLVKDLAKRCLDSLSSARHVGRQGDDWTVPVPISAFDLPLIHIYHCHGHYYADHQPSSDDLN